MTTIVLAIIIGVAFGFTLDRIGATNPGLIIRMLNLSNLHLMKTILTGIGVASVLLFAGLLAGLVDPGHLSVKAAYTGGFCRRCSPWSRLRGCRLLPRHRAHCIRNRTH